MEKFHDHVDVNMRVSYVPNIPANCISPHFLFLSLLTTLTTRTVSDAQITSNLFSPSSVREKKIKADCLRTVNPACTLQGQCKQVGSESFSVEGVFQWAHQSYQNLQCQLFMHSLEILGIQLWSISDRLFLLCPPVCFSLIYIFTIYIQHQKFSLDPKEKLYYSLLRSF